MADFKGALPSVIKWSVGENKFDEDGSNPKSLGLFIPAASIDALATHLSAMAADSAKLKTGKIWDYNKNEEVEVSGVYLNAKGKTGEYGDFGNINPVALGNAPTQQQPVTSEDLPF
jgi:hypothetical protein